MSSMLRARRATIAIATSVSAAGLGLVLSPAAHAAGQTVTTYAELQGAVSHKNDVVLGADINDGSSTLQIATKPVSVDLQGHDLDIDTTAGGGPGIDIPANGKFVLKDTVGGGEVTIHGGTNSAGIHVPPSAQLRLGSDEQGAAGSGVTLTVTGGANGAGIGGNTGEGAGKIITIKGKIVATGGTGGAGIGGGAGGPAASGLVFDDGQITATGGAGGAGIGGGTGGAADGTVRIHHAFVKALAGDGAAAVGAGAGGSGGVDITVEATGNLDADANGSSAAPITLGSLNNAGLVQLPDADAVQPIPDGVTVVNSGKIRLYSTLSGTGSIDNSGLILPTPIYDAAVDNTKLVGDDGQGPAGDALYIFDHNYTVNFTLDGRPGTAPLTQHVYAATIAEAKQTLPDVPTIPGYTCEDGWFTAASGGTQVLDTTVLDTVADPGPSDLLLHPHCTVDATSTPPSTPPVTNPPTSGGGVGGVSTSAASTTSSGAGIGAESTSNGSGTDAESTSLAQTGWDTTPTLALALLLLVGGAGLVFLGRGRSLRALHRKH